MMHLRLFLCFLTLRKSTLTERDLSASELDRLRSYAAGNYDRGMLLAFGQVRVVEGYVLDTYDFHPQPWTSLLNALQNLACLYHRLGYPGYKIKIKLI
ncbi:hypothetical protein [Pontibacter mangrovi]|uniref:Uncharacterized protein n=1 Tax=Pontibacter mangrovi TaxID=2589816 RepID=A0A501W5R5_9BACT|nr:hypothetical protein [Pontibacter mangrovi]TPE44939.1 hypothetical protein FJM65_07955 [Pontibacter mangrovi]